MKIFVGEDELQRIIPAIRCKQEERNLTPQLKRASWNE